MDREEILKKSREEYKQQDAVEKEVIQNGARVACIVAAVLAGVFFMVQILTGNGQNYALFAVIFSLSGSMFWYKYIKLRRKHELVVAIAQTVVVVIFSSAHIWMLFTSTVI